MTFNKKDIYFIAAIFIIALSLRLPFISYPDTTVFDEGIFSTYTIFPSYSKPYIDIHPPLGALIFSKIVEDDVFTLQKIGGVGTSFGDFPYIKIRYFNAILGSVLAVIIYILARLLTCSSYASLMPAFLVVVDNAIVLYSRRVLLDMLLLTVGFGALALFFFSKKTKNITAKMAIFVVSAVFFGLAASVKWTGLGFAALAFLLLFRERAYKKIFLLAFLAASIYVSVSAVVFSRLPI